MHLKSLSAKCQLFCWSLDILASRWRHQMETFPRNWPFVRGIHRSPVNSPHKGQWRGALMFSLICVWINDWVDNREAGDLRRYCAHYDVIVMLKVHPIRHRYEWAMLCGVLLEKKYITFGIALYHSFSHLTQWGRDKMAPILQRIFWNPFSWMKIIVF